LAHTLAEKILLAHTGADAIAPGDVVMVRCDVVMTNDISGPIAFRTMREMGVDRVFDPARVVLIPDHFVPAKDARSAELQQVLKRWADEQGVVFYGQGRGGIEHQVLVEDGWVVPGSVVAGGDSHTCTHGALGAFGTGLGSTDVACCLAFGEFWQVVPGTIQVEFRGTKGRWVSGKDLILAVLAEIGVNGGTGNVLEFIGDGAEALTIDERLAVANMAVEAGSETGIFPADATTAAYLEGRTDAPWTAERTDPGAEVAQRLTIDLDGLPPLVARPHSPGNVAPLDESLGTRVDQVYIGNCANGTMTDLRQAAEILRGRQVHPDVRVVIVPSSRKVWREALAEGLLDVFTEAGAMVSTPTCGACFGGGMGILAPGETAVATTNRNFRGRMGGKGSQVFLANAHVAAAAAVAGELVDPAAVVGAGAPA
jgi:3-isopropylmalate/(R)-2-methylmalate dehydratase large subunit